MNCTLTNNQRKEGTRCRSFDCVPCKEFLTPNDRSIIDNEIIKMLKKEIESLRLEVKHGCSICALDPETTIRDLESQLEAKDKEIEQLQNTIKKNWVLMTLTDHAEKAIKLEKQNALMKEVLESINKMDISENPPDVIWLNSWRNNTKERARKALKKLEGLE